MAALAAKQPTKPTQPLLFSSEWDLMYVWTYDWPHRKNPMNLNNSRRRASSSGTSRQRPSSTCNPKPLKCQVYLYQNIKYPTTGTLALYTHWGGGLRVRELSCNRRASGGRGNWASWASSRQESNKQERAWKGNLSWSGRINRCTDRQMDRQTNYTFEIIGKDMHSSKTPDIMDEF